MTSAFRCGVRLLLGALCLALGPTALGQPTVAAGAGQAPPTVASSPRQGMADDELLGVLAQLMAGAANEQAVALKRLGEKPDPRALSAVRSLVTDKNASWQLRSWGVWALGAFQDGRAVHTLRSIASDGAAREGLRLAAIEALGRQPARFAGLALVGLRKAPNPLGTSALAALRKGHPVLHAALSLGPAEAKTEHVVVGTREDRLAVELLAVLASKAGSQAQIDAMAGLASLGREEAVAPILAVVSGPDGEVSAAGIEALKLIPGGDAVEGLRGIWSDLAISGDRRLKAIHALAEREDPLAAEVTYELLTAIRDEADPTLLSAAIASYERLHPQRAKARARALEAPAAGDPPADVLVEALLNTNASVPYWQRLRAASWLAMAADPRLVPVQAALARDPSAPTPIKTRAVAALRRQGSSAAAVALQALSVDAKQPERVRKAAVAGLSAIAKGPASTGAGDVAPKQAVVSKAVEPGGEAKPLSGPSTEAEKAAVASAPIAKPSSGPSPQAPLGGAVAPGAEQQPAQVLSEGAPPGAAKASPISPSEPVASQPTGVATVPVTEPEPEPWLDDGTKGLFSLIGAGGLLGATWTYSMINVMQDIENNPELKGEWVRILTPTLGALLGGGSLALISYGEEVELSEAAWFASAAGLGATIGALVPLGLGMNFYAQETNLAFFGAETVTIAAAYLSRRHHGLDVDEILYMDSMALTGAAAGLGLALQYAEGPQQTMLPMAVGLGAGALHGWLTATNTWRPAERRVVTYATLNAAALGTLTAWSFQEPDDLEALGYRPLLGGGLLGGGLGLLGAATAAYMADPDLGDVKVFGIGEAFGATFGLGAGLLLPQISSRFVPGVTALGAVAGGGVALVVDEFLDLGVKDIPLLTLGSLSFASTGILLGEALRGFSRDTDALSGGVMAGGVLGLTAAGFGALHGVRRDWGQVGYDIAGSATGLLGGYGLSLMLPESDSWDRFLFQSGGMWAFILASELMEPDLSYTPGFVLGMGGGATSGALIDIMVRGNAALEAPTTRDSERSSGTRLEGATLLGLSLGLATSGFAHRWFAPSGAQAFRMGFGAGFGLMVYPGLRLLLPEKDPRLAAGVALGTQWGLMGLYSQAELVTRDVPLLTLGMGAGGMSGVLLAQSLGVVNPSEAAGQRQWGAFLLGAPSGMLASTLASRWLQPSAGQAFRAGLGGVLGGVAGWGLAGFWSADDETTPDQRRDQHNIYDARGTLPGMWAGLALGWLMEPEAGDAPLLLLGTGAGMASAHFLRQTAGEDSERAMAGALRLGSAGGLLASAVLASKARMTTKQAGMSGLGGLIGSLGGLGFAWHFEGAGERSEGAGMLGGLWMGLVAGAYSDPGPADMPLLGLGTLVGTSTAYLLQQSLNLNEDAARGSLLLGASAGLLGSDALGRWVKISKKRAAYMAASAGVGSMGGLGLMWQFSGTTEAREAAGMLAGLGGGLAAGAFLEIAPKDAPWLTLATVSSMASAYFLRDASITPENYFEFAADERSRDGALLLGASVGLLGAGATTRWIHMDGRRATAIGVSAGMGTIAGRGAAWLVKGQRNPIRSLGAGQLFGLWGGLAAGALTRPTHEDLPELSLGSLVGAGSGYFLRKALGEEPLTDRDEEAAEIRDQGGLLLGFGASYAGSLFLAPHLKLGWVQAGLSGASAGLGSLGGLGAAWLLSSEKASRSSEGIGQIAGMWLGLGAGIAADLGKDDIPLLVLAGVASHSSGLMLPTVMGVSEGPDDETDSVRELRVQRADGARFFAPALGVVGATALSPWVTLSPGQALMGGIGGLVGALGGVGFGQALDDEERSTVTAALTGQWAGLLLGQSLDLDVGSAPLIVLGTAVGGSSSADLWFAIQGTEPATANSDSHNPRGGAALFGASAGMLGSAWLSQRLKLSGGRISLMAAGALAATAGGYAAETLFAEDGSEGALRWVAGARALGVWGGMLVGAFYDPALEQGPLLAVGTAAAAATSLQARRIRHLRRAGQPNERSEDQIQDRRVASVVFGASAGLLGAGLISHRLKISPRQALWASGGGMSGWLLGEGAVNLLQADEELAVWMGLAGMWSGLLGVGLGVDAWELDGPAAWTVALVSTAGGLHGLGWASVIDAQDRQRMGALQLGAGAGLVVGATLARKKLNSEEILHASGGHVMGGLLGLLSFLVFMDDLGSESTLAASLVSSYAGLGLGLAKSDVGSLALGALGGTVGFMAGEGAARLIGPERPTAQAATAIGATATGILLGGLAFEPPDVSMREALAVGAIGAYASMQGMGWAQVADLGSDQRWAAARLGLALGLGGGAALTHLDMLREVNLTVVLGTSAMVAATASGAAYLYAGGQEADGDEADDIALATGLVASAVGLGGGRLLADHLRLSNTDLVKTSLGTTWGLLNGSLMVNAFELEGGAERGAYLLGAGLGTLAGTLFAKQVEMDVFRGFVVGSGLAWGWLMGFAMSYGVLDLDFAPEAATVGVVTANLGVAVGLGLAHRSESLRQIGYVNLAGLLGTGVGAMAGVAMTSEEQNRLNADPSVTEGDPRLTVLRRKMVASAMVGGAVALATAIVATWNMEFEKTFEEEEADDAKTAGGSRSDLAYVLKTTEDEAIVIPSMGWLPPARGEDRGPVPMLQVTILH